MGWDWEVEAEKNAFPFDSYKTNNQNKCKQWPTSFVSDRMCSNSLLSFMHYLDVGHDAKDRI